MAGPVQWGQHLIHLSFGVMARWLILDWRFLYGAFLGALAAVSLA